MASIVHGLNFYLLPQNYTHIPGTIVAIYVAPISKARGPVWVTSKFTTLNEPCYSNQVLDTQVLWVVNVKERNSRIESSTKFSKFRDNQPKAFVLPFPTEDVEQYPLKFKNLHIILQCMLFQFKSTFTIVWSLGGKM